MRLDHLLSKEHQLAAVRRCCPGRLFRGRPFSGRHCSLVERRLFGLLSLRELVSTATRLVFGRVQRGTSSTERGSASGTLLGPEGSSRSIPLGPSTLLELPGRSMRPGKRGSRGWHRPYLENYTVDASIFVARQATKGTWWMPWHQEPMKDVGACDKPREVGNRAVIRGFPNGETQLESCPVTSA